MARAQPQIIAAYLEGIDSCLKARRQPPFVTLAGLLDEIGLVIPAPLERQARIPLDRFAALLELGAKRTGDEVFGMHVAQALPVGVAGVFGFLVTNAPDMRSHVELIARYSRLLCDSFVLTCETLPNTDIRIRLEFVPSVGVPDKQLMEFCLSLFVGRVRRIAGEDWAPIAVRFPYREPNAAGEYEHLFGVKLTFDASAAEVTVSASNIGRRNQSANPELFMLLTRLAEDELAASTTGNTVRQRLDAHLVGSMASGGTTLIAAATALDMPVRSLQSELKKEGTSFALVLGDARRRLAERYLRDTDLSMTEIAMMLGFSQIATFTRAARDWFDVPPSEARARLRASKPG